LEALAVFLLPHAAKAADFLLSFLPPAIDAVAEGNEDAA
jgi:hypothetical protein